MATNGKEQSSAVTVQQRRAPSVWAEDVERFFERAFGRPFFHGRRLLVPELGRPGWLPDMDVFERDGKTVVRVDLPGMKREDVEVTVEKDMLLIRGHREEEKEVKEAEYYCSERATGYFSRGVSLPEGVKADQIKATYSDGVLEVVVPKATANDAKSVQVPIK